MRVFTFTSRDNTFLNSILSDGQIFILLRTAINVLSTRKKSATEFTAVLTRLIDIVSNPDAILIIKSTTVPAQTAPEYLENIVRLPKYFETYH